MLRDCPNCLASGPSIKKTGSFVRKSDSKKIQRYQCKVCKKNFSNATFSDCYHQNKRRLNPSVKKLLCSGVSIRRTALILNISRTTVARKLTFLAFKARRSQNKWLEMHKNSFSKVQFDDLETFHHTKCKPITVTLFVEETTRKIIDFEVSQIPAKGPLAQISRKKYGKRENKSFEAREQLFQRLQPYLNDKKLVINSDQSPFYISPVAKHFSHAEYKRFKGKRGCITGQGELKKIGFDPLFSINHTFAMLRGNINRLFRRTWCTTKKVQCLRDHIALYVDFHNSVLTNKK